MTFSPGILWDYSGSLYTLGYVEMKLPTSSQDSELLTSLLDLNWPWGSLGRIQKKNKMLDGQPPYSNLVGPYQYPVTDSKI
jgi:hypothetical protein